MDGELHDSWEIEKDLLVALVFHVFITTSRLVSTSIVFHSPLILKKCPFLLEKKSKTSAINKSFTIS